uniref:Uncharacterized protein n=1 Tax=Glossina palpalis gambiensis TaxID=67801 RepID=A0A1B0B634_9MUSC
MQHAKVLRPFRAFSHIVNVMEKVKFCTQQIIARWTGKIIRFLQHFMYLLLTRIKQNDKLSLLLLSTVSLLVVFVLLLMLMLLLSLWLKPLILTVSALVVIVSMMMFVIVLLPDSDAAVLRKNYSFTLTLNSQNCCKGKASHWAITLIGRHTFSNM